MTLSQSHSGDRGREYGRDAEESLSAGTTPCRDEGDDTGAAGEKEGDNDNDAVGEEPLIGWMYETQEGWLIHTGTRQ